MALDFDLRQRIDDAKALLDRLRPLPRDLEARAMQKFRLWWTYHSNAIEGNSLTQGETEVFLMEGLTAKNKPLKDHLDLRGHSDAINYLQDLVRNKDVLTEAAIRKLHEVLLVEPYEVDAITPTGLPTRRMIELGTYKTQPNHVRTRTGKTHYYATPEETPAKMHDLMDWYRSEQKQGAMHAIEIAARYHHRFTAIHPFDDGNGRMSRILMNLILMQAGFPPAVIRIGERDSYLAALRRADRGEYEEFVGFIGEHVVESLELFVRAAKGEEIHEPTDLEKEIALLKMELAGEPEPNPPAPETQQRLFESSLDPLMVEIARQIFPIRELFWSEHLRFEGTYRKPDGAEGYTHASNADFIGAPCVPRDPGWWRDGPLIGSFELQLELSGFRKASPDNFAVSESLELSFGVAGYSVTVGTWGQKLQIRHSYEENLTKAECTGIAQRITRSMVEAIRRRNKSLA